MLNELAREKVIDIFLDILQEKKFKTLIDHFLEALMQDNFPSKDKLKISIALFQQKIFSQERASKIILTIGWDAQETLTNRMQAASALSIFGNTYENDQMDIAFDIETKCVKYDDHGPLNSFDIYDDDMDVVF